jgi:serine/threonine protein kinase
MNSASPPSSENDLDFGPTLRGLRAGWKVFGRYTLVRQLGRGGMGVVWLARDEKLELEVALKFLPENLVHDEIALDDLRRETRRCMKLTHQNIVHVYDLVDDEATAAIAMEHVEGKTLSALRLERPNRVLEAADILPWLRQVCEALDYAHTKAKIVHHDLKPGNIMVGGDGEVKVMDFGIASSIHDSASRLSKAAKAGSGGGTLPYMSPQQLMGLPPSVSDDVYALGATIYELLTGKPPFFRGSLESQIQTLAPLSMAERRAELKVADASAIPEVWEKTVGLCLAKETVKRPPGVMVVWKLLQEHPGMPATNSPYAVKKTDEGIAPADQIKVVPKTSWPKRTEPEQGLRLKGWRNLMAPALVTGVFAIMSFIIFMDDHIFLACGCIVGLFCSTGFWFTTSLPMPVTSTETGLRPSKQLNQAIHIWAVLLCVLSFAGTIVLFSMERILLACVTITLFFAGVFVWRFVKQNED